MRGKVRVDEDWVGRGDPEVLLPYPDRGEAGLVEEVGFLPPLLHQEVGRVAFEEVVKDVAVESQGVGLTWYPGVGFLLKLRI
jgi:hypothetical protein